MATVGLPAKRHSNKTSFIGVLLASRYTKSNTRNVGIVETYRAGTYFCCFCGGGGGAYPDINKLWYLEKRENQSRRQRNVNFFVSCANDKCFRKLSLDNIFPLFTFTCTCMSVTSPFILGPRSGSALVDKRKIIFRDILKLEHIRWRAIANPHALEEI